MNVVSSMWQTPRNDSEGLALAPPPDFRYVGLSPSSARSPRVWAGLLGIGAVVGFGLCEGLDAARIVGLAGATVLAASAAHRVRMLRKAARESFPPSLAIVPWGVLLESEERSSALHWAAIDRVETDVVYGRDLGTPTTRYSLVTIETARERLVGRAAGAVSLERLSIHLPAYAREASHVVALDLDGDSAADGPSEPTFEPLLSSARAYVASAGASDRLDLPARSYRQNGAPGGARAVDVLGAVLRDRTARRVDPRPFAAVVAAEIGAAALVDDLIDLVQSPHPVVAAVAKVAATRLGVCKTRVGALDEVEPFLLRKDADAIAAWGDTA
jgi:hypothetical protein